MHEKRKTKKASSDTSDSVPRVYSFRLTDADGDVWEDKVRRSGMNQSEFFRTAVVLNETTVVGDASQKKRRAVRTASNVHPDIKRANFLLAQASNNLNQIAHRLNADNKAGLVTPALYAEMLEELQSTSATIKERF